MGKELLAEVTQHPFGKGSLTTNGEQYCTEVGSIANTAYEAIETVTLRTPGFGHELVEISFSLTGATKSSSTAKDVLYKWQISGDNSTWQDLCAEQTRGENASAYLDATLSGVFAPTGNFLGNTYTFYIRFVLKAEHGDETVTGKTKSSSWVKMLYRGF